MKLSISSEILDELHNQVRYGAPLEICGLLFGEDGRVSGIKQTDNVARNTYRHFEIDPVALIAAERDARDGGPSILGYYHSHPTGDTSPSETDAGSAAPDEKLWLILTGSEASAWQAVESGEVFGRFDPISLERTSA